MADDRKVFNHQFMRSTHMGNGIRIDKEKLEKQITALSDALAHLNSADDLRKLILLIKNPGWTTPAEYIFALGLVNSMLTHVKALDEMKTVLLRGSNAVAPQEVAGRTAA
jgi:hypothetical protein